jgi:uncharacterized membrane protein YfcA
VSTAKLALLIAIFFVTSIVSVVTGSTSLITIPAMISLGMEPHVAIATNMLALTLMSVGGSVPFVGKGILITGRRLHICIGLTLFGSALGALLVLSVPVRALQIVIAAAMVSVAAFTIRNRNLGVTEAPPTRAAERIGYAATFLLAVYGGFFSGGYVTLLTTVFVVLLGMNFLKAVANTKLMNVFSSGIATPLARHRRHQVGRDSWYRYVFRSLTRRPNRHAFKCCLAAPHLPRGSIRLGD